MLKSDWFYDNAFRSVNKSDFVSVDRIYCLKLDLWEKDDWDTLAQIYEQLPEYLGDGCWFGQETSEQYLWASVEPTGLQIGARFPAKTGKIGLQNSGKLFCIPICAVSCFDR